MTADSGQEKGVATQPTSEPRQVPEEEAATPEEVAAALEELSNGAWVRLHRFAAWRVRGVPAPCREARDEEDLLSAAITATLDKTRRWRRGTDLVGHLLGVMRSISSHWKEKAGPELVILSSDLRAEREDGSETDPVEAAPADAASPEEAMIAKDLVQRIEAHFATDPLSRDVLAAMMIGLSRAEMAVLLNVDELSVNAAARKVQRHVRIMLTEGKDL